MPTHLSVPRPTEPEPGLEATLARCRQHVDELDTAILELVARRRLASQEIQQLRVAAGGPRIQHARERAILARYRDCLGIEGSKLALTVLELCRGRA